MQATNTSITSVRLPLLFRNDAFLTRRVVMNLSHVITEFSFGPYFPDITQPLDNSFELTQDRT